jgi:DNA repair photolyase
MPFRWTLNPYMGCVHRCTYCYVRAYEKRADRPSDDRYGTSIRVKTNIAEVLRLELKRRSWKRETVAIGAATDPYQPAEGKYRLTRSCLEVLAQARTPVSLITRGPMVVRDIDVLQEVAGRGGITISMSIPTLDPDVWRKTEPGTSPPHQRLRAIRMLTDAGINAGVAMAPILPGITDDPAGMEAVVGAARDAGATGVWANLLWLRSGTREHFLGHLARDWPELLDRYRALYRSDAYLPESEQKPVLNRIAELRGQYDIGDRRHLPIAPPPQEQQLSLLALVG